MITHSITKAQRMKRLFNRLLIYSLPGIAATNILDGILDYSSATRLDSSIKSCKQLLELLNINSNDTTYKAVFSVLKKIGYIAKIKGHYVVNPAVDTNLDKKQYEVIIEFYSELFKDTDLPLTDLESLKWQAVNQRLHQEINKTNSQNGGELLTNELYDLYNSLGNDKHHRAHQELYDIAFGPYDKKVSGRRKAVLEHYRNNCNTIVYSFIDAHTQMLIELGLVYLEGIHYKFNYFECKNLSKIQNIQSTDSFIYSSFTPHSIPEYGSYPWFIKATNSEKLQWLDSDSTNILLFQEFNRRLKLLIP